MTDEKTPADRVLELLLFAPVGFALSARDLLPQLVERGRQQVTGQVTMAKLIGQLAVKQGTKEAEKAFVRARTQAETTLEQLGVLHEGALPPSPASPPARNATPAATGTATPAPPAQTTALPAPPGPPAPASPPAPLGDGGAAPAPARSPGPAQAEVRPSGDAEPAPARELAIPDYDSLSASQVLPRLSGLSPIELEAVRAHEAAHRGRKTILNRVTQLQAS